MVEEIRELHRDQKETYTRLLELLHRADKLADVDKKLMDKCLEKREGALCLK